MKEIMKAAAVISLLLLVCICSAEMSPSIPEKHNRHQQQQQQLNSSASGTQKQWIYRTGGSWDWGYNSGEWEFLNVVPLERARVAMIGGGLAQLYGIPSNASILDVGCGEGLLFDSLPEEQKKNYVGVDISSVAIQRAQKQRGLPKQWVAAVAHEYVSPHPMDVIVFSEMLMYVEHEKVLKQYEEYLTVNGTLIISLYCEKNKPETYANIRSFARKHFRLIDAMELSGTSQGTRVTIRIDVFRKKPQLFNLSSL
jgi:2-polyprenyl-3-methyl-5-hydroxy-6-metoxy-1,4-benzoquinol methylase